MPPSKRASTSPQPPRSSSRLRQRKASTPPRTPKGRAASKDVSSEVVKRAAKLEAARNKLSLLSSPIEVCRLFSNAALEFFRTTALEFATRTGSLVCYVILALYAASKHLLPDLYAPPACGSGGTYGGPLFTVELLANEFIWWLVLGILSSIGFGTGLHSGIMFLWPFVIQVITQAENCASTRFPASYNHPCALECTDAIRNDGSYSYLNTLLILLPSVVVWGSGTAIGELPPYFITRAAKRAGKRSAEFDDELAEAKEKTDVVSRLKVMTIEFTEKNGFMGILLLASWPNAAFDMCGMACGWLEMPFWTFFGATLLGKGVIKVTLQTVFCILIFGPACFQVILKLMDHWAILKVFGLLSYLPVHRVSTMMCKASGIVGEAACTIKAVLQAGRNKTLLVFALQTRQYPESLLEDGFLMKRSLVDKYCYAAGLQQRPSAFFGRDVGYEESAKYKEMLDKALRAFEALDANGDEKLDLVELSAATSWSDGKLSLASLDPGTGRLLSVSNLWNGFILLLILFFVYSIVEQVARSAQAAADDTKLAAYEAALRRGKEASTSKNRKE